MHARGTFEVKMGPLAAYNQDPAAQLGRASLDKVFHGDLEGTSQGEMLTAGSPQSGSAGYVAVERVKGTLHGKRGTFALQHHATMHAGAFSLEVVVVPGSGTDELKGLRGAMQIAIADGRHSYELEYDFD